jgi:Holliday junction resolvasome RuvABC endonuclease subunit
MVDYRVVGIDLSLTSTGLASAGDEVKLARIRSAAPKTPRHPRTNKPLPPTLEQRRERLGLLCAKILTFVMLEEPNLVCIEAPAYSSNVGSMHDRSGLWWLVVNGLFANGIPVTEITPTQRAKYATGKGTNDKDKVLAAVIRRYPDIEVTGNDVADALALAAMGRRRLGQPLEESLPKPNLEAMVNVRWPVDEVPIVSAEPVPY